MIKAIDYFRDPRDGSQKEALEGHRDNAYELLARVNALIDEAVEAGAFRRLVCVHTGTEISGSKGGSGDGGYRLPNSTTGATNSSHRAGQGVDPFDPGDRLDKWLDKFEDGRGGNSMLEKHKLYREHPDATPNWCHLTTRSPGSGIRTFRP